MDTLISWLLDGDPAIRWQVQRDLLGASDQSVAAERRLVGEQGWGARLLALQEPDGKWGGGIYGPKWISTHYTLLTLRGLGVQGDHPQVRRACALLLERGFYQDGGINYFTNFSRRTRKVSETCITGMVLNMLAFFAYDDERLDHIAAHLVSQQMADGGWNCESYRGATHSSFHTTLSVLEGLAEYRGFRGAGDQGEGLPAAVEEARMRGEEFLLAHRLFRSHRSGEIFDPRMLRFPYPPRWRYDILRALDYFQGIGDRGEGERRDGRMQEAIDVIKKRRLSDGCWPQHAGMSGRIFFELEPAGQPGRWNTLRGLRVLKWWEADT